MELDEEEEEHKEDTSGGQGSPGEAIPGLG